MDFRALETSKDAGDDCPLLGLVFGNDFEIPAFKEVSRFAIAMEAFGMLDSSEVAGRSAHQ